jgi:hypothetical protein
MNSLNLPFQQTKSLQDICSEICTTKSSKEYEEEATNSSYYLNDKLNENETMQKIPLNVIGVIRYYQDFVHSFLSNIDLLVCFNESFYLTLSTYICTFKRIIN